MQPQPPKKKRIYVFTSTQAPDTTTLPFTDLPCTRPFHTPPLLFSPVTSRAPGE